MSHILLVDDETAMLNIINKVIHWEALGIDQVYMAKSAREAREILQKHSIDITICDIEMPQESGLDLIGWIQGLYPGMIHIILTGHADFNYARSAISLGVFRFLLKPVSFDELEETLALALERVDMAEALVCVDEKSDKSTAVLQVKKYIEENYNSVITRNDIEKLVHLNRDYINREFKTQTGYTLMEYIQYYRIHMSKKLIRGSSATISDIGLQVGYDSPAYFAKIFKKRTGMTPMEFREHQ